MDVNNSKKDSDIVVLENQENALKSFKLEKESKTFIIQIKNAGILIAGQNNKINFLNYEQSKRSEDGEDNREDFVFNRDDIMNAIIRNDPKKIPTALRRTGACAGKRYAKIMNQTRYFQDSGLFNKLEMFCNLLLPGFQEKGDIDLQVVVLIQRSVMYIYQKNPECLQKAKNELKDTIKLAEKAENNQLLTARCLQYLAYVATNQGESDDALEYLDQASAIMALFVSGEDKAFISYLYGNVYMEKAGSLKTPSAEFEMKAVKYFETDMKHITHDEDTSLISKRVQFARLKQIQMLLRTYSNFSPQYTVPSEYLTRAKKILDMFELNCWSEASLASKVFFTAFRADYFARIGKMDRALAILETEGVSAANEVCVKPLYEMINVRIWVYKQAVTGKKIENIVIEEITSEDKKLK